MTFVQGGQATQQFLWLPSGHVIVEQVVNASGSEDRSKRITVGVRKFVFIENDYTSTAYSMFTELAEHNGSDTTRIFKVQQLLDAR